MRISGHKSTRQSCRVRWDKINRAASSDEALAMNIGKPLVVGEFESIVIQCTANSPELANIDNKEFHSYKDALRCIDKILDVWES